MTPLEMAWRIGMNPELSAIFDRWWPYVPPENQRKFLNILCNWPKR